MKREAAFSSSLGPVFHRYVELKRVLGRDFSLGSQVLHSLDQFLGDPDNNSPGLTSRAFQQWCRAQEKVSSRVRRSRMRTVYNFCLYRRRTEPRCFVPDLSLFPLAHPGIKPYIFSESDTARLLAASSRLRRFSTSPLRPEVIGLAISLLYTTEMRRGELLGLTVSDYDSKEGTLLIRDSKFHKSRVLPLHQDMVNEINHHLQLRRKWHLPMKSETPLIWNSIGGGRPYTGTGLRLSLRTLFHQCSFPYATLSHYTPVRANKVPIFAVDFGWYTPIHKSRVSYIDKSICNLYILATPVVEIVSGLTSSQALVLLQGSGLRHVSCVTTMLGARWSVWECTRRHDAMCST